VRLGGDRRRSGDRKRASGPRRTGGGDQEQRCRRGAAGRTGGAQSECAGRSAAHAAAVAVQDVRHTSHTRGVRRRRTAVAVPFPAGQTTGRPDLVRCGRRRSGQHAGRADRGERQEKDLSSPR